MSPKHLHLLQNFAKNSSGVTHVPLCSGGNVFWILLLPIGFWCLSLLFKVSFTTGGNTNVTLTHARREGRRIGRYLAKPTMKRVFLQMVDPWLFL